MIKCVHCVLKNVLKSSVIIIRVWISAGKTTSSINLIIISYPVQCDKRSSKNSYLDVYMIRKYAKKKSGSGVTGEPFLVWVG